MIRDSCKLYNGDCLEIMEELIKDGVQVDLTVTSPPYDDLRNYNNSLVWNFDIFKEVANKLYSITKDGGVVVWVVNDKTKNGDFMEYDDKYWNMNEYGKRYNVWEMKSSTKVGSHTATFPEELADGHIISWSNEGDLVFDPFMGSGTTGKMALLNNRKFIGIEKVEEYFEISKNRVKDVMDKE